MILFYCFQGDILSQIHDLIRQCDTQMRTVTVAYFQLQHTVTAPLIIYYCFIQWLLIHDIVLLFSGWHPVTDSWFNQTMRHTDAYRHHRLFPTSTYSHCSLYDIILFNTMTAPSLFCSIVFQGDILSQIHDLIKQCDTQMRSVTVAYFQLQYTMTAPFIIFYYNILLFYTLTAP